MPLFAALAEMVYQWELPYLIDDGDFCRTFGMEPTGLDEAIAATLGLRGESNSSHSALAA